MLPTVPFPAFRTPGTLKGNFPLFGFLSCASGFTSAAVVVVVLLPLFPSLPGLERSVLWLLGEMLTTCTEAFSPTGFPCSALAAGLFSKPITTPLDALVLPGVFNVRDIAGVLDCVPFSFFPSSFPMFRLSLIFFANSWTNSGEGLDDSVDS